MLTKEDITQLSSFPKFEPSYDIMTHKNVQDANILLAIPEGKKCFVWFTKRNHIDVCLLLELNETKNIIKIEQFNVNFNYNLSLSHGTILQGICFKLNDVSYFSIEDIYFGYGNSYMTYNYQFKLNKIKYILENEINQTTLSGKCLIFGVPLMSNSLNLLLKLTNDLPYKIDEIRFRYFLSKKILTMKYYKPGSKKRESIMKIMPDIDPDIYHVYSLKDEYCNIASIPNYKTSIMMNRIFRKIKGADNLNELEESDNEEEFQDSREDKYVYLDRTFNFVCEYNSKFKKWTPVRLL
jgi:hypothetical protein